MALLFCSEDDDVAGWRAALARRVPGLDFRVWPETGDPAEIEAALVWRPPPGLLASLPRLGAAFSLAAGVDALLADPTLPPELPICRMVDPSLTRGMGEFALLHALRYHRDLDAFEAQQREAVWKLRPPRPAESRTVGVMGLGVLGLEAARVLARADFAVRGWGRTARRVEGVEVFAGRERLGGFLDGLEILVCLLPLTPETEGILGAPLFERLPEGARLVNLARGGHLVEADLLGALDTGRLAHATLDVFREEPLPRGHPFWRHPKVTVTPHAASWSSPETGADGVVENLRRLRAGLPLEHLVDRGRGY